jgi:hypothetical protein
LFFSSEFIFAKKPVTTAITIGLSDVATIITANLQRQKNNVLQRTTTSANSSPNASPHIIPHSSPHSHFILSPNTKSTEEQKIKINLEKRELVEKRSKILSKVDQDKQIISKQRENENNMKSVIEQQNMIARQIEQLSEKKKNITLNINNPTTLITIIQNRDSLAKLTTEMNNLKKQQNNFKSSLATLSREKKL